MYKEELLSKPALLVVNKMDLPDAEDKLAELKEQLEKPCGKFASLCLFKMSLVLYLVLWDSYGKQNVFFHFSALMHKAKTKPDIVNV